MKCPFCVIPCNNEHCAYKEDNMSAVLKIKPETDFKDGDDGEIISYCSVNIEEHSNGFLVHFSSTLEGVYLTKVYSRGHNELEMLEDIKGELLLRGV